VTHFLRDQKATPPAASWLSQNFASRSNIRRQGAPSRNSARRGCDEARARAQQFAASGIRYDYMQGSADGQHAAGARGAAKAGMDYDVRQPVPRFTRRFRRAAEADAQWAGGRQARHPRPTCPKTREDALKAPGSVSTPRTAKPSIAGGTHPGDGAAQRRSTLGGGIPPNQGLDREGSLSCCPFLWTTSQPEFTCRFSWRSARSRLGQPLRHLHNQINDYNGLRRVMHRTRWPEQSRASTHPGKRSI